MLVRICAQHPFPEFVLLFSVIASYPAFARVMPDTRSVRYEYCVYEMSVLYTHAHELVFLCGMYMHAVRDVCIVYTCAEIGEFPCGMCMYMYTRVKNTTMYGVWGPASNVKEWRAP